MPMALRFLTDSNPAGEFYGDKRLFKKTPKAPAIPDPYATAAAQTASDKETAWYNAQLANMDQEIESWPSCQAFLCLPSCVKPNLLLNIMTPSSSALQTVCTLLEPSPMKGYAKTVLKYCLLHHLLSME